MRTEIVTDDSALDRWIDPWDRLASEARVPFAAPHWVLPWWRHVAPETAELRIVLAIEDGRLVGVAPLFVDRSFPSRYRLLAAGTSLRGGLIAEAGRQKEVAEAIATTLADTRNGPRIVQLEGISTTPGWASLLSAGSAQIRHGREWSMPAPVLDLTTTTFEEWFQNRSANFRHQLRRAHRDVVGARGTFHLAEKEGDDLERQVDAFCRLHRERWASRGGSATLTSRVRAMLQDAAPELARRDRLRLWSIEVAGEIVGSQIFLAAGGEVSYWLGGFDERFGHLRPGMVGLLRAIEHSWERGDARFDLGPGGDRYKYRFTDAEERLEWWSLVLPGRGHARARAQLVALATGRRLARRLPARARLWIKSRTGRS